MYTGIFRDKSQFGISRYESGYGRPRQGVAFPDASNSIKETRILVQSSAPTQKVTMRQNIGHSLSNPKNQQFFIPLSMHCVVRPSTLRQTKSASASKTQSWIYWLLDVPNLIWTCYSQRFPWFVFWLLEHPSGTLVPENLCIHRYMNSET